MAFSLYLVTKDRQVLSLFSRRAHSSATTGCYLKRLGIGCEHDASVSAAIRVLFYIMAVLVWVGYITPSTVRWQHLLSSWVWIKKKKKKEMSGRMRTKIRRWPASLKQFGVCKDISVPQEVNPSVPKLRWLSFQKWQVNDHLACI